MSAEAPSDPWADRQLASVLANALGAFGRRTRLDANVAAKELGVSPSTVRRWVRNGVPERRRDQVAALVAPETAVLDRERRELLFAREALWDIAGRGAPISDAWKRDGWLRPHLLTVVLLRDRGVLVVRLTNPDSGEMSRRLRADGGEVIEEVEFRNRFRAQVAKGELLEAVSPWRVIVPSGRMSRGRTQAWLASAPRPTLTWLRDHPQVKIPVTKPRKRKEPRSE